MYLCGEWLICHKYNIYMWKFIYIYLLFFSSFPFLGSRGEMIWENMLLRCFMLPIFVSILRRNEKKNQARHRHHTKRKKENKERKTTKKRCERPNSCEKHNFVCVCASEWYRWWVFMGSWIHRIINKCVPNVFFCVTLEDGSSNNNYNSVPPLKLSSEQWAVQVPSDILIFCSELLKVLIILIYDVDYYGHNPHPQQRQWQRQ